MIDVEKRVVVSALRVFLEDILTQVMPSDTLTVSGKSSDILDCGIAWMARGKGQLESCCRDVAPILIGAQCLSAHRSAHRPRP